MSLNVNSIGMDQYLSFDFAEQRCNNRLGPGHEDKKPNYDPRI